MKHFEEGMKALDSGDTKGAIMHLQFAEKDSRLRTDLYTDLTIPTLLFCL